MSSRTIISTLLGLALFSSVGQAAPVAASSCSSSFPTLVPSNHGRLLLSNGFPNPDAKALKEISKAAGGTLSNIAAAKNVTNEDSLTNFKLIAFNELFEVAFFTELLQNITGKVPGYEVPASSNETYLIEALKAIQAQEELHTLDANSHLPVPIQPCAYTFPVSNLHDAIALATTFTDVVLGTLQDVSVVFATHGDSDVVGAVASVIGQEGEQQGFFRSFLGKRPSSQPFLTAGARAFAFSALRQSFVVPGSCPDVDDAIPLETLKPLMLLTQNIRATDSRLRFSFDTQGSKNVNVEELGFVLVNGQNKPVVLDMKHVKRDGDVVTFEAEFPFEKDLLFGLTVAAVVRGRAGGNIETVDDVARAAVFGPALIEVA